MAGKDTAKLIIKRIWSFAQFWQFWVALSGGGIVPPILVTFIQSFQNIAIGWQIVFGVCVFVLLSVLLWRLLIWFSPISKVSHKVNTNQVTNRVDKPDKLTAVIDEIIKAQKITTKGTDIVVYITPNNILANMLPEELETILLKLQNDDKVLTLKYFPKWLLEKDKTKDYYMSNLFRSPNDPSLRSFTVSLLDGFDKYIKNLKN